ncbi:MAG: hypothetical protein ACTSQ7_01105 [Alphaproteobacteria bacterium]
MTRTKALVACLAAAVFLGSGTGLAAAESEAPPPPPAPIDWRDFVDDMEEGDHVVGEELCAAPGAVEPAPNSFVNI